MHKNNAPYSFSFIKLILSVFVTLLIISTSTILTLNLTSIYSYAVDKYDLVTVTGLDKNLLIENYLGLIRYSQNPFIPNLTFKSFAMSPLGEFHFFEVKKIFMYMELYILVFILAMAIVFLWSKHKKELLLRFSKISNYSSNTLLLIIVLLSFGFVTDFSKVFDLFHKIVFNNNYWVFNPDTDPVINALPEEFFMLCGISILSLVLLQAIIFKVIYHVSRKKKG